MLVAEGFFGLGLESIGSGACGVQHYNFQVYRGKARSLGIPLCFIKGSESSSCARSRASRTKLPLGLGLGSPAET